MFRAKYVQKPQVILLWEAGSLLEATAPSGGAGKVLKTMDNVCMSYTSEKEQQRNLKEQQKEVRKAITFATVIFNVIVIKHKFEGTF